MEQEQQAAGQVNGQLDIKPEALKTSEKRFQTVTKVCGDYFQQVRQLEKKLKKAEGENEEATVRIWALSNEANAMVEKLKLWRKRAREYDAALRGQKMRGSVFRETMRAKLRHLVKMQK